MAGGIDRRLRQLEARRPSLRSRPDLSLFADDEIDELRALKRKAGRGEPFDAADAAALARLRAAAERREAGRP